MLPNIKPVVKEYVLSVEQPQLELTVAEDFTSAEGGAGPLVLTNPCHWFTFNERSKADEFAGRWCTTSTAPKSTAATSKRQQMPSVC